MRLIPLILICTLLFSCSVKKRSYRKGYYINWAFHHDKKIENRNYPLKKDHAILPQNSAQLALPEQEVVLTASAEKFFSPKQLKKHDVPVPGKAGGCDTLFFRDGKVVAAKILEILPHEIRYKRCDYPDGPIITVNKNDVAKAVFSNGMSEQFEIKHRTMSESASTWQNQSKPPEEVKNHEAAYIMLGITISILFFSIISAIAGLIYAPTAMRRIKESKGKFRGEDIVDVCKTICLVALILSLIFLAFFFFVLFVLV